MKTAAERPLVGRESLAEWSVDHERRRLQADIEERRRVAETPIYPRELAQKIATDVARQLVPDWRLVRDEHRALYVQLLKQQPELQQREVRQFDNLIRLIGDQLPVAMRPLMTDLRLIYEFKIIAHETAAFFVGLETGRRLEHLYTDANGRLKRARGVAPTPNRLHLAVTAEGGAR